MSESFWLVIAGGLVAIVSSLIPLLLQHRWDGQARRRAVDVLRLDAAVQKLMAWQDLAVKHLTGGDISGADRRLLELDALWDTDFSLIPDQAATQEVLSMSKQIFVAPGAFRNAPDAMQRMDHLIALLDQAIVSARKKRRELA